MQLHNAQFVELSGNQAPLYVSFNPDGGARGELALRVFESSLEQRGDTTHPKMVSQSFACGPRRGKARWCRGRTAS